MPPAIAQKLRPQSRFEWPDFTGGGSQEALTMALRCRTTHARGGAAMSESSPGGSPSPSGQHISETTASPEQFDFRRRLTEMFLGAPLSTEDLLFNIGLYARSSVLVKFLVMGKLYERIKDIPGVLVEFGTWYGHNLVLMENLRAIYEPFNKQRKIIGFDTFEGYKGQSREDKPSEVWRAGSYATGTDYRSYLAELLRVHEGNNVLGHVRGAHELVAGDVCETVPRYFSERRHLLVAFAYFDLGLYEPTKAALEAVLPHLVPGSVLLFDELTWPEAPGEATAFREVFAVANRPYRIEKDPLYPSKAIVTILA